MRPRSAAPTRNDHRQARCLLLAGGLGTRLRPYLGDRPKALADIAGRPFLDHLLDWLARQGLTRVTLCAGHRATRLLDYYGRRRDLHLDFSVEPEPLGTWGALRLAHQRQKLDRPFFVLNGDSWADANLGRLWRVHHAHRALASLAVCQVPDAGRFGSVALARGGRVRDFAEKTSARAGWVNAGMYLMDPAVFDHGPAGPGSIERDLLPALLARVVRAVRLPGGLIDIGTPASCRALQMHPRPWLDALGAPREAGFAC